MILFVSSPRSSTTTSTTTTTTTTSDWDRFQIMLMCCLATSISYLRYQIIVMIHASAMKNESYTLNEVARLLCYHHSTTTTPRDGGSTNHPSPNHHDTTTTMSPSNETQQHSGQYFLHDCYVFCQTLQLSMTMDENGTKPLLINDKNGMTLKDPLFLQRVRVVFKVHTLPTFDNIRIASDAPTTTTTSTNPYRVLRTRNIDRSIFVLNNNINNNDSTTRPSPTKTTSCMCTSPDGIVIPTSEWFYNHHLFF